MAKFTQWLFGDLSDERVMQSLQIVANWDAQKQIVGGVAFADEPDSITVLRGDLVKRGVLKGTDRG